MGREGEKKVFAHVIDQLTPENTVETKKDTNRYKRVIIRKAGEKTQDTDRLNKEAGKSQIVY